MPEQLALDLPVHSAFGREDFFVSAANAQAVEALENWPAWPLGKLVLSGPPGSGKSHLARIWAETTGAAVVQAKGLAHQDVAKLVPRGLVIEDLPEASADDETAIFHAHNLAAQDGAPLLLTGRGPSAGWRLGLPDLASRVAAAMEVRLGPPDDNLLHALIIKLFADRQLDVRPNVLRQILARIDRSFVAAEEAVERIDKAALARKAAIGNRLVADVLHDMEPDKE